MVGSHQVVSLRGALLSNNLDDDDDDDDDDDGDDDDDDGDDDNGEHYVDIPGQGREQAQVQLHCLASWQNQRRGLGRDPA